MTRVVIPLLAILLGCPRVMIGVEDGIAKDRPAYATVSGEFGGYSDTEVVAATVQLRTGPAGTEFSGGALACASTRAGQLVVDGCARAYALELGWRRDHVTFGGLSPAIGPAITVPFRTVAPVGIAGRHVTGELWEALTLALWLGVDIRVAPTRDTAPYVGLQVGFGYRILHR